MSDALAVLKLLVQENDLYETLPSLKLTDEVKGPRRKTQLRKFLNKAEHIQAELGTWAADYFIGASIDSFKMAMREGGEKLLGWKSAEKDIVMTTLSRTTIPRSLASHIEGGLPKTSAKFECLLSVLSRVYTPGFCGLVFVNQRATVVALSQLLLAHPKTQKLFRCGTFVGMSNNVRKKTELGDLLDPRVQQNTLGGFREGSLNLIIATNALEEGIDVSACNTVICFDEPPNFKSFIQRRGRARKEKSNFFVLLAHDSSVTSVERWRQLEQEMTEAYQRDRMAVDEAHTRENVHEQGYGNFVVESTGALLTMDSALAHLNHFWTTLPKQPYVALQPVFSFAESEVAHQIWATVCLPSCMDPSLRQIRGIRGWHSERMASKDAAFQAYVKLHQAGLVNDHLLPFRPEDLEAFERRPPFVSVPDQYDPWIDIAASWKTARSFYHKVISINRPGLSTFEIALVLPIHFRSLPDFPLHVDAGVTYSVSMHEQVVDEISTTSNLSLCRRVCDVILRSVHNEIMVGVANDFVVLFLPILEKQTLQGWLSHCSGSRPASTINFNENPLPEVGLLRDKGQPNSAFVSCHQYNSDRYISHHPWTREHNDQTTIPAKPLTTRRNFLHQDLCGRSLITNDVPAHHNRATTPINLPKDCCMVDCLPYDFAQYALLAPSILYRIEVGLVAEQLCTRMCPFVRFNQLGLVIDSICASCIHLQTNHEQFEFLGSSLLKIIITRQLFVNHTNWHEGYLSKQRDLSVSNSRLVEAALKAGLDEFVLTRNFNGHMWRPLCVSELGASSPRRERLLPVKLLASAVEALIGAAFLDNDLSNAIGCARFFLPEIKEWSWTALYDGTYITSRPRLMDFPPTFTNLEFLLGHRFHDKSLLVEAMTHPSCDWSISTCSYQRLAFLGDAVLEMIVTECLARDAHFLSRDKMHLCKAASTNAHFLAFLCMGASPVVEVFGNGEISDGNHSNTNSRESLHPWMFLRYSGVTIATGRDESLKRHAKYVGPIRSTLSNGLLYPWQDLAQLAADGFFSDIVQSLLGAIYIDSKGDLTHSVRLICAILNPG